MQAKYVRLYAGADGESHFEDATADLDKVDFAPPSSPIDLSASMPAKQLVFLNAPAGWESDWHVSASRNMFVVVSGEWEVETSDGVSRRFGPNTVMLVEDTVGKGHRSRVISETGSLSVVVELKDNA